MKTKETFGCLLDMKLFKFIADRSYNIDHNELPAKFVDGFSSTELKSNKAQFIMLLGIRVKNAESRGLHKPEGTPVDWFNELDLKMSLRRLSDYSGVKLPGLPLFQFVGKKEIAAYFNGLKNTDKSILFPGSGDD